MYQSEEGLVLQDFDKCIGCRLCQLACPCGVVCFNDKTPHARFQKEGTPAIPGGTATGAEVAERTGAPIPYYNPARAMTYAGIRPQGVVEKCTFCDHRLAKGELPWCVEACPAGARIFGDLNDLESPPSKALATYAPRVLKKEKGTRPQVFYIRDF